MIVATKTVIVIVDSTKDTLPALLAKPELGELRSVAIAKLEKLFTLKVAV